MAASSTSKPSVSDLEARVNSLELENLELRKRSLRESAERWNAVAEAASLKAQIAAGELYKLTEKEGSGAK